MATYRVPTKGKINGLNIDKAAMQKTLDNILSREVTRYKNAGLKAMQELRTGAIDMWYRDNTDSSMKAATKSEVESIKQNKGNITITITSYVDIDEYNRVKMAKETENPYSIYEWREKWVDNGLSMKVPTPGGLDYKYDNSPADYLVYLQWELGIRGLPEKAEHTKTGWTNRFFDQTTPMRDFVGGIVATNWISTVNKYLQKG